MWPSGVRGAGVLVGGRSDRALASRPAADPFPVPRPGPRATGFGPGPPASRVTDRAPLARRVIGHVSQTARHWPGAWSLAGADEAGFVGIDDRLGAVAQA
ncbi:hypothetical protein GCM10027203_78740 [Nonomuraea fastidiosa]